MGKIIIVSAPSGAGKNTIINKIIEMGLNLQFAISATSREPRKGEVEGVNYYFLSEEDFRKKIENDEFIEYEEVYTGRFYGTLKSEIERITSAGKDVILDVDVLGGINIKKFYGNEALGLFVQPPSIDVLRERLIARGSETMEVIDSRIERAEFELSFACKFDEIVINGDLETACKEAYDLVKNFIEQ